MISDDQLIGILDKLNLFADDIAIPAVPRTGRPEISYAALFKALIEQDGMKEASQILGLSKSALETFMTRTLIKEITSKTFGTKWSLFLLSQIGCAKCSKCNIVDNIANLTSGKNIICRVCSNATTISYREHNKEKVLETAKKYRDNNKEKVAISFKKWADKNVGYLKNKSAERRIALHRATPNYDYGAQEELDMIKIYDKCPKGYHVDHIIPIKHPLVCGLHVPCNLQYLPAADNIRKSNHFEIT